MAKVAALWCAVSLVATPLAAQGDLGPPPGRLVDVGGYRLHIHCTGTGAPTVVLASGASSFAIDWALVQPEVARTNRVCSYDRAGMGWSDSTGFVATAERSVSELHALLSAAGERPPYVLVGASLAGIYVRLYQLRYRDEVAGLVLVDPAHEDRLFTMFKGEAVTIASLSAAELLSTLPHGPVTVPKRKAQRGAPFDRLPPDLYRIRIALDERLIASVPAIVGPEIVHESAEGQRAALAALHEASAAKAHSLGSLPLVVLTRGIDADQGVRDVHARAAALSTNSRHIIVDGAGHEVHLFEPAVVIAAIGDVVEAVRGQRPLKTP